MNKDLGTLQTELSVAYNNFSLVIEQLEPEKRLQAGVSGQWTAKDVIAHLIGWDSAFQAFIVDPDGFDPTPLYETNSFNAQSVSDRRHQSWEETISELQNSFTALQKSIETVTDRDEDI